MANTLIAGNSPTMTSREIAELTGKQHSHVMRDIETMLEQLGERPEGYIQLWAHPQNGQQYREYALDREHTECLVTGYSASLRMKVIKRLRELEGRGSLIPQTLPEALRLAADLAEQKQQLETQLAIAAPKVEFAERVGEAKGVLIGNFAKAIGMGPNKLFAWMREHRVLISSAARRNVPLQEYMDRGYFTVRETPVLTNHGIQISFTTQITGKGQQWLMSKLSASGVLTERMAG